MKKLAICIPNYNKPDLLFELLKQSIDQIEHSLYKNDIEICISDDASPYDITDDIDNLINNNKAIAIKYQRLTNNKGRWGNIKEVVAMADAEYCWVIGNDDIYACKDAINNLVTILINDEPDILTFPTIQFDGIEYRQFHQLPVQTGDCTLNLLNKNDFNKWYDKTSVWLNFFSDPMIVLFRKKIWNKHIGTVKLDDNGFGFWIALNIIAYDNTTIKYVEQFFIVRSYSEDEENNKNENHSYRFTCDILMMWKQLLHLNKNAARIFDNCSFNWYLRFYFNFLKSMNLTTQQKKFLTDNITDAIKLIERFYLPKNKIIELKHDNAVIFGTDGDEKGVINWLLTCDISVNYFIDNCNDKQGTFLNEIEIISPKEAKQLENCLFILSVNMNETLIDAYEQLKFLGIDDNNIILIGWH